MIIVGIVIVLIGTLLMRYRDYRNRLYSLVCPHISKLGLAGVTASNSDFVVVDTSMPSVDVDFFVTVKKCKMFFSVCTSSKIEILLNLNNRLLPDN